LIPRSTNHAIITVTGCIQRAEQATTGTSGRSAANRGTSETKFLLTNAAMSTSGTTGTAGTTPRSTAASSEYRLDADDAKLIPHVGHKVEITGTTEQPPSTTQPPAGFGSESTKAQGRQRQDDRIDLPVVYDRNGRPDFAPQGRPRRFAMSTESDQGTRS